MNIQEQISSFPWWYQTIEIDGIKTPGRVNSQEKWDKIISPFLGDIKGKTILDFGCNAGFNMVKAIDSGARIVHGVEIDDMFFEQSQLVLDSYKKNDKYKTLNVVRNIHHFNQSHFYDIVFAFNVLYWVGWDNDIPSPNLIEILKDNLKRLSAHSKSMFVIGSDCPIVGRSQDGLPIAGTSLAENLKYLEESWDIVQTEELNLDRNYCLIWCNSKYNHNVVRVKIDKVFNAINDIIPHDYVTQNQNSRQNYIFPEYAKFLSDNYPIVKYDEWLDSEYCKWIKKRPIYHDVDTSNDKAVLKLMERHYNLFLSKIENTEAPCDMFFELDGYHRFTICQILNMKDINIRYKI